MGSVVSSVTLTSVPAISSVLPASGSIYGGAILTITGNGFNNSTSSLQVSVGTGSCSIIQITPGQIQCTVPAQGSSPVTATVRVVSNGVTFPGSFTYTYNTASSPSITSITPTSGTTGQSVVIVGSNFVAGSTTVTVGGVSCAVTSASSTSITCTIGSGPAGNQPVLATVASIGQSNNNIQFQYILQVTNISPSSGSYGGGQLITITGNGFNGSTVSVTICGQPCQPVTVISNTQLTCRTPPATFSSSNTPCSLMVTAGSLSQTSSYVYTASLTATITAINPVRGGTGGGTLLTVTGTNFP